MAGRRGTIHPAAAMDLVGEGITDDPLVGSLAISSGQPPLFRLGLHPEFPRPLVIAFNVLFGTIVLLAVFQIALDVVSLAIIPFKGGFPSAPAGLRYAIGVLALGLSAYGASQAIRVPPLNDIELPVAGLPPEFDGYRMVQLTDLHISRLFPAAWTKEVD